MIDSSSLHAIENNPQRLVDGKMIYPCLLNPGVHKIDLTLLEEKVLHPFADKRTRSHLCNRLRELISVLSSFRVEMIIWLDGSLCSLKPHPSDIDLVIFFNQNDLNNLETFDTDKLLNLLENRDSLRARYGCDLYFESMDDLKQFHYWRSQFSYNQLQEAKGFIQLRVNSNEHSYS